MKTDITITATTRASRGKNEARRLRVTGQAPAIVYGAGKDPVAISLNPKEVFKILHSSTGKNTIFNVDVTGVEVTPVMVVDWQNEPIRGNILHVDLKRIDLTKRIAVRIPVHITGEAQGVKLQGGLLELITRDVEIECLPIDIPEEYVVDVSELMIGQSIRASDLKVEAAVKLLSPPESVIVHVIALRAEETAAAEPGAEGAAATSEPEVIKKGKKEEEAAADEKKKK